MNEFIEQFENAQRSGSEIISKLGHLVDSHIKLYKEEAKENKNKLLISCLLLIAGSITGISAIVITSFFFVHLMIDIFSGLTQVQALGIVALVWILATIIIVFFAFRITKKISFAPTATISSLKESYKCLINIK